MKVISEREATLKIKRTYDKNNEWAKVYVTETATNYYVTIHIIGYELPSVFEWKLSKKGICNMLQAVQVVAAEARKHENI